MTDPQRLSDEELAAIERMHRQASYVPGWCVCGMRWPCDAVRLLADRRALAEQAAIGAAVERLGDGFWFVSHQVDPDRAYWHIGVGTWTINIDGDRTFDEAVAAALDPEPRA